MGLTFVIAATGPSLTIHQARAVAMARASLPDLKVIAVNDAIYPFWFADIAYACDASWWRAHKGLPGFGGWRLRLKHPCPDTGRDRNPLDMPGVDTFTSSGNLGFDPRPGFIRHGGNSGYQAVHIAAHLEAERIILLGFDMRSSDKKRHWFGEHLSATRKAPANMKRWIEVFGGLASELRARHIEVVNASPGSALTAFPLVDLEATLKGLRNG